MRCNNSTMVMSVGWSVCWIVCPLVVDWPVSQLFRPCQVNQVNNYTNWLEMPFLNAKQRIKFNVHVGRFLHLNSLIFFSQVSHECSHD